MTGRLRQCFALFAALLLSGLSACVQTPEEDYRAKPLRPYVPDVTPGHVHSAAVNGNNTNPSSRYVVRKGDKLTVYFTGVPQRR